MEASGIQAICKKQVRNRIKIFIVNKIVYILLLVKYVFFIEKLPLTYLQWP